MSKKRNETGGQSEKGGGASERDEKGGEDNPEHESERGEPRTNDLLPFPPPSLLRDAVTAAMLLLLLLLLFSSIGACQSEWRFSMDRENYSLRFAFCGAFFFLCEGKGALD